MFRPQYDGCRARAMQIPAIPGICEEADRPFTGMFKRTCRFYPQVGVTPQFGTELPGQLGKCEAPARVGVP